jgi:hypothetical protein
MTDAVREVVTLEGRDGNRLDLELEVEPGKRARLVTLTIHEIEGEGITAKLVRERVAGDLAERVRMASGLVRAVLLNKRLDAGDHDALERVTTRVETSDGGSIAHVSLFDSLIEPRIFEDVYAECAAVYEAAPEGQKQKAVMDHFHIELSAAKLRIMRARERGFLPATETGKQRKKATKKGEKR